MGTRNNIDDKLICRGGGIGRHTGLKKLCTFQFLTRSRRHLHNNSLVFACLFVLFLLFMVTKTVTADCVDLDLFHNQYYIRLTAVDLEGHACISGGSIRGTNAIKEYCPTCKETWQRRWFEIAKNIPTYICDGKGGCVKADLPWYKVVQLDDFITLRYVYKYQTDDGDKARIVFEMVITR